MNQPLVSIIIPCYNYSQYVLDCVYSCVIQDYQNLEIIVVDDRSTDNSYHALISCDVLKDKFKLLQTKINSGYSAAKNLGIRASSGEFIATLDADDMLLPDSISRRVKYLIEHPDIGFVHGNIYLIKDQGGYDYYMQRIYKLQVHSGSKVHAPTPMVRRSVHKDCGLYDDNLRSRSDNEMWYRLRTVCGVKDHKIEDKPLAFYRKHSTSMIAYRKKNPIYNMEVSEKLIAAKEMRLREGVNPTNTPWLKK